MKKTNYNDKERKDLLKSLYEKRKDLREFRFGNAGAKSTNTKEARNIRKDVARILTAINKK